MKKYSSNNPNPIDKYVGSRIRFRREQLGYSQEKLGVSVGVTFQQVQKIEKATNRAGASRLFDISRVLDVPVSYFFDGLEVGPKDASCDLEVVVESANKKLPYSISKDIREARLIGKLQKLDNTTREAVISIINKLSKGK